MRDLDDVTDRLFDTAEQGVRLARARRVDAINHNPRLSWVVEIDNDGVGSAELVYDQAPEFEKIVADARRRGVLGYVQVRSITVRRMKQRPLVLMPWHRARHPATNIGE